MSENANWKSKALFLGGLIGALAGLGAAYVLVQRAEREGEPLRLGAGEGFRVGITLLGLLRSLAQVGDE